MDSVKVVGYDGYSAVANGEADLLITGSIANGTVAQVRIPDLARSSEYRASVVAAAARATYVLQDLTGYRALLVR
jgi:phage tail tube protein FII